MEASSQQPNQQEATSPGEIYEQHMVPAIFGVWAPALIDLLLLQRGQSVLDVACGTGAVTRHIIAEVGPEGHVVGLDMNSNMLAMARRVAPEIEWREGSALDLPFAEQSFDAVVCQQGMQFFPDKPKALREMLRVLRPGGRLALAMWLPIEANPGHYALVQGIRRHINEEVASLMLGAFSLGEADTISALLETAKFREIDIRQEERMAQFPSLDDFIMHVMMGSAVGRSGVRVSDETLKSIIDDVRSALQSYVHPDGLRFPTQAHLVVAIK